MTLWRFRVSIKSQGPCIDNDHDENKSIKYGAHSTDKHSSSYFVFVDIFVWDFYLGPNKSLE